MNQESAKAEAEKIREPFRDICVDIPEFDWEKRATRCAIIHVKGVLDELEKALTKPHRHYFSGIDYLNARINDFKSILTELER